MLIGFIGLGKMGGALARNLVRKQYNVKAFDLSPEAIERVTEIGGSECSSAAEAARDVDVLFISLPLPEHLLKLFVGDDSILEVMRKGSTIIDVGSNDPQTVNIVEKEIEKHSMNFMACPLGKGPAQAEEGTQPIFAGGNKKVFESNEALLNDIGNPVTYLGSVEQSTSFKLISNMIGMTNLLVMSEGINLGINAGIEPKQLIKLLINDTGADSYQLKLRAPWILEEDFEPRFATKLALKDLKLGLKTAEYFGQSASTTELSTKLYEKAIEEGYEDEDCSAVFKIYQNKEMISSK